MRIGRAGHSVGEISRGVILPKFRGDLLESAAVVERMQAGEIETTVVPANPLDVVTHGGWRWPRWSSGRWTSWPRCCAGPIRSASWAAAR